MSKTQEIEINKKGEEEQSDEMSLRLTPEQIAFAKLLGDLLAKRWREEMNQ